MILNIIDITRQKLHHITNLSANKEYNALKAYFENGRNIDDFFVWLHNYCIPPNCEKVVTVPPNEAFNEIDITERIKSKKAVREFHVLFDLWVNGEKSELTLECEVEYHNDSDRKPLFKRDMQNLYNERG